MSRVRTLFTVVLVAALSLLPVQVAVGQESMESAGPLPLTLPNGSVMSDDELLGVEGELGFILTLLALTALGAGAGAGATAISENWFDEDYGIDGDDWREIASGAVQGAIGGLAGGCGARCFPI